MDIIFRMALFLALTLLFQGCDKSEAPKPNFLILLADDMGYADLNCYGGASNTPNLDELGNKGILCTDFYAPAPNCSPSRAALLTGRHPTRTGMYSYRSNKSPMHLRDSEITIAELLKKHGYQTPMFGKWHLGALPKDSSLNHPQPLEQGFDYFYGAKSGAKPSHLNPVNFYRNDKKLEEQKGYSCQLLANEAIRWLNNNFDPNHPFFMYVAFHEPHAKIASPPNLIKKYSDYPASEAEYLANIENLDSASGKIIAHLKKLNVFENTFILFASDNGGYRLASNGGLKAKKAYLYEGGIRVPGIIHWPALQQDGVVINQAISLIDILPTICDILDINPMTDRIIDGTSVLPVLQGRSFTREKPLYWFFYRTSPEIAVRIGDYMIVGRDNDSIPRTHYFSDPDMNYIRNMSVSTFELYDLSKDIRQESNIYSTNENATELRKVLLEKIDDVQQNGYQWESLRPANGPKKIKNDWVPY